MAYALTSNANLGHWSKKSQSIYRALCSLEKTVCLAVANTFFSDRILLGRLVAVVLLILQARLFVFGSLGAILTEWAGHRFSQNKSLQTSRIFGLNGFFIGLAASTFLTGFLPAVIAVLLLSAITSIIVIVSHRLLKTWDLPLLVLPYCISFWMMQLLSQESHVFKLTVSTPPVLADSVDLLTLANAMLLSFSQIFFSANWVVGSMIAAILIALDPKRTIEITISALFPNFVAYLCVGQHWAILSGLTGFSGVLLLQAHRNGFLTISHAKLWAFVGFSGLFEVIVLKFLKVQGIFALSASYVVIYWLAKLSEEVRQAKVEKGSAIMTW